MVTSYHSQVSDAYFFSMQINLKGLDGVQGPVYVGTGCVFRRQALYGYEPPLKGKESKAGCGACCPSWCCGPRKKGKSKKGKYSDKKKGPARTDSTIPIFSLEDIEEGVEGEYTSTCSIRIIWNS